MVAGMVMPLADLRAIYELLFRDGVLVAKKDKRPQSKHPEVRGVTNLQVMRAMGSLKSRGYVRETFAWRHFYWYLTNEGIVYLRDYLRLPAEIVPSSLQRVRRPATTLNVVQRAARVQTVEGPMSYAPKPASRAGTESQESLMDRQGYRRKRMTAAEEEEAQTERTPRFRGRPIAAEPPRSRASWEFVAQSQQALRNGEVSHKEVRVMEESQVKRASMVKFSQLPPDTKSAKTTMAVTSEERALPLDHKGSAQMAGVQKITATNDAKAVAEPVATKPMAAIAAPVAGATAAAAAVAMTMAAMPSKGGKEKAKKMVAEQVSQETPKQLLDQSPHPAREVMDKTERTTEVKATWEPPKKTAKENVTATLLPPTSPASGAIEKAEAQVCVAEAAWVASKPPKPKPTPRDTEVTVKAEVTTEVITQVSHKKTLKISETQKSPEPTVGTASAVAVATEAPPPTKVDKSKIKKTSEVKLTQETPKPELGKLPTKPAVAPAAGEGVATPAVQAKTTAQTAPADAQRAPKSSNENAIAELTSPPVPAAKETPAETPVEIPDPTRKGPDKLLNGRAVQESSKPSSEIIASKSAALVQAGAAGPTEEVKVTTQETVQVTHTSCSCKI
ncbi:nascent polypeptide-associated complex subunit alpha, muscle-specific form-like [Megalops cyprinoides]|uniref:nascent polypeptide-associated complex subunit alpha, muscle-specific form-like n=1 Tax=Megalops cyprinoides TaxID=118141 RepID=UPI0018652CEC|nr:nascent polypeptide-associated complex subunit alpha, muscle-specific form-like [Megalops cyprinoides]